MQFCNCLSLRRRSILRGVDMNTEELEITKEAKTKVRIDKDGSTRDGDNIPRGKMVWPKPRDVIRKGNFPYKFKLYEEYSYETTWSLDEQFDSKWLKITKEGLLTIKVEESAYCWDGCTPKWSFLNLVIIGTPDGHIDHRTMKPFTYHASLVHDVLYQYLDSVPVSKENIDLLFLKMLGDFKLRKIYYLMVKYLGGKGVVQFNLQ